MNCQEVIELMQRQLDNDLEQDEIEQLTTHTRHCPDCAALFERLTLLSAELTALPRVSPSYSIVDAIMPKLELIDEQGQQEAAALSPMKGYSMSGTSSRRMPSRRTSAYRLAGEVVAAVARSRYIPSCYSTEPIE